MDRNRYIMPPLEDYLNEGEYYDHEDYQDPNFGLNKEQFDAKVDEMEEEMLAKIDWIGQKMELPQEMVDAKKEEVKKEVERQRKMHSAIQKNTPKKPYITPGDEEGVRHILAQFGIEDPDEVRYSTHGEAILAMANVIDHMRKAKHLGDFPGQSQN